MTGRKIKAEISYNGKKVTSNEINLSYKQSEISKVTISGNNVLLFQDDLVITSNLNYNGNGIKPQSIQYQWEIYENNQWKSIVGQTTNTLNISKIGVEYSGKEVRLKAKSEFNSSFINSNELTITITEPNIIGKKGLFLNFLELTYLMLLKKI